MPLDHYVTLGRSGLRVSPLCLGAMTFGEALDWGTSAAESRRMLDRYVSAGGNFIDTANVYMRGESEQILGEYLAADVKRRHSLVIATKFFGLMHAGDPNAGGAGRKSVIRSCEESLRRLRTDYIDLYWMHAWDPHTPIEETMHALDELVRSGKVRYLGFSDTPAWKVVQAQLGALAAHAAPLVALQLEYSLLERTIEAELVPMALEFGLGIAPWSPLKGGLLSGKYRRDEAAPATDGRRPGRRELLDARAESVIDALAAIATELGASSAQVALAWIARRPGVTSPIIGARTLAQLEANLGAIDLNLSADQVARLEKLSRPQLPFPADLLRRVPALRNPGMTINGERGGESPLAPVRE